MTDKHQDDPQLLKALTEVEKANLLPDELASDGEEVLPGVAPPDPEEVDDADC